jgi:glycolate oxidase FAD binding subunit
MNFPGTGTTVNVASRLSEIVGPSHVATDFAQVASYEIDRKMPAAIVRPGSAEEAAAIVKFAASEKLSLVPAGSRSKLGIGFAPTRYDFALDTTRLDRILSYDPGDLTLSVEPGVKLERLAQHLADHHQFLPLALPFMAHATVGGAVASGVDSPLRQMYGTARDYLLGVEFVTGEGVPAKSGGRVVKNVTGYDIHKLMIGALGTLGVITRVNFKTFPMPMERRGYIARFASPDHAFEMCHRIAQSSLAPLSVEIFSPQIAELFESATAKRIAGSPLPKHIFSDSEWAVSITYAGNDKVLARFVAELSKMADSARIRGLSILIDNLQPAWNRQREFIPIALASSPAATIVKTSVLPMRMKDTILAAKKSAETHALPWAVMARGLGIIYFAILPPEFTVDTQTRVSHAVREIQDDCTRIGGHATIPWCPAEWKSTLNIWGPARPDFPLMQKVKNVFDPHGTLSPGRFVGGL